MGAGYSVDVEQLRSHASSLEALQDRFEAIRTASSHIAQDDEAYGTLCGWISGVLEDRHQRQDALVDFVGENLGIAAQAVRSCADDYEASDIESGASFTELEGRLGS